MVLHALAWSSAPSRSFRAPRARQPRTRSAAASARAMLPRPDEALLRGACLATPECRDGPAGQDAGLFRRPAGGLGEQRLRLIEASGGERDGEIEQENRPRPLSNIAGTSPRRPTSAAAGRRSARGALPSEGRSSATRRNSRWASSSRPAGSRKKATPRFRCSSICASSMREARRPTRHRLCGPGRGDQPVEGLGGFELRKPRRIDDLAHVVLAVEQRKNSRWASVKSAVWPSSSSGRALSDRSWGAFSR